MAKRYQPLYDAIKIARDTGESWVTWDGERLRLVRIEWRDEGRFTYPCTPDGTSLDGMHFDAVVKSRRSGGVRVAWIDAYKDVGDRIKISEGGEGTIGYRAGWDKVLAIVKERHPRVTDG